MPGGLVEVAALDPDAGPIFYAFDPRDARPAADLRARNVLPALHGGSSVEPNAAIFARRVFATDQGEPLHAHGSEVVTEQIPFERRWGGWYVTGYEGKESHRGNTFAREREGTFEFSLSEKRPFELSGFFETSRYLAPTSDIVALLVFEHQLALQNSLLRAGQSVRHVLGAPTSPDQAVGFEPILASAVEMSSTTCCFARPRRCLKGSKAVSAFEARLLPVRFAAPRALR